VELPVPVNGPVRQRLVNIIAGEPAGITAPELKDRLYASACPARPSFWRGPARERARRTERERSCHPVSLSCQNRHVLFGSDASQTVGLLSLTS
jgi:hypothetical protein